MILKQGHKYRAMPHDGKLIAYIYRGGRCYYQDSPYSLAATQALRAAFPQYWTAIRDYGYAHPQLVPFINEDPMLIVSLVEVGKVRWLVSDGTAYCDTGLLPADNITYGADVVIDQIVGEMSVFGARSTPNSSFLLQVMNNKWRSQCFGGWKEYGIANPNTKYNVEFSYKGIWVDGTAVVTGNYVPNPAITNTIWVAWNNNSDATHGTGFIGKYANFYRKDADGNMTNRFVPFKRNGEMELLDIVTLTLATRVGTFTEIIEDKQ